MSVGYLKKPVASESPVGELEKALVRASSVLKGSFTPRTEKNIVKQAMRYVTSTETSLRRVLEKMDPEKRKSLTSDGKKQAVVVPGSPRHRPSEQWKAPQGRVRYQAHPHEILAAIDKALKAAGKPVERSIHDVASRTAPAHIAITPAQVKVFIRSLPQKERDVRKIVNGMKLDRS